MPKDPDPNAIAYSVKQTARLLGVGRSSLYEQISSGALRAAKIGKRTIILKEDLQAFLAASRI